MGVSHDRSDWNGANMGMISGIAVCPTWMVVRKHVPIGYDPQVDGVEGHGKQDVEQGVEGQDKRRYTVGERAVDG